MVTLAKGADGECVSYLPQFIVRDPVPPVYLFISCCLLFLVCGCIYALVPTLHHFSQKTIPNHLDCIELLPALLVNMLPLELLDVLL